MSIHETLTPTDDAEVQIEATADTLKPVFAYADKLVDEFKLRVDSDGLRYDVVDPANVTSLGMEVPAEAFDAFEADETVIGIPIIDTKRALRAGRKRQNDTISASYSENYLTTEVHREYDGVEMDLRNRIGTIDPDAIRQTPDIDAVLEENLTAEATVPRRALEDALNASGAVADHVQIQNDGNDLCFGGQGSVNDAGVSINDVVEGDAADSAFALDYLNDLLKALATVEVDDVTLHLGEEYPMRVEWETEFNDATVTGYWFQAPRIQS